MVSDYMLNITRKLISSSSVFPDPDPELVQNNRTYIFKCCLKVTLNIHNAMLIKILNQFLTVIILLKLTKFRWTM